MYFTTILDSHNNRDHIIAWTLAIHTIGDRQLLGLSNQMYKLLLCDTLAYSRAYLSCMCFVCSLHCAQSKQLQVHMVLHWINSMMAHSSGNSCILDFLLSHIFKSDCPVVIAAATATADTCWIWACDAAYSCCCCCCCCYCTLLLSMTSIPKLKRITLKYTCVHCL